MADNYKFPDEVESVAPGKATEAVDAPEIEIEIVRRRQRQQRQAVLRAERLEYLVLRLLQAPRLELDGGLIAHAHQCLARAARGPRHVL